MVKQSAVEALQARLQAAMGNVTHVSRPATAAPETVHGQRTEDDQALTAIVALVRQLQGRRRTTSTRALSTVAAAPPVAQRQLWSLQAFLSKGAFLSQGPRLKHTLLLERRLEIGAEVVAWRAQRAATSSNWLQAFVRLKFGAVDQKSEQRLKMFLKRCEKNYEESKKEVQHPSGRAGPRQTITGSRTEIVKWRRRRRCVGGGRTASVGEISFELFQWWVDMAETLHARVPSNLLLHQAELLRNEVAKKHGALVNSGEERGDLSLPIICPMWLSRWRREWGLTWKTVNLRYKISYDKAKHRVGVLWRNIIRLRALHQVLYGPGMLRFVSVDQKPFYMSTTGSDKTLARKGSGRVRAKENPCLTRERFTGMTVCPSWDWTKPWREGAVEMPACWPRDRMVPPWAVLFKSDSGATLKETLRRGAHVLLQFAPCGSYRCENMLEYLDWLLPHCQDPKDAIVPVYDWYAPHKNPLLLELVLDRGHGTDLLIGGGITSLIQVPDVAIHSELQAHYKDAELHDNLAQLRRRPKKVPKCEKQHAIDRGSSAWESVDHGRGIRGHVKLGFTTALDGSQDHLLAKEVLPFWQSLDMCRIRPQLIAEVEESVRAGDITSWHQAQELLEAYDDHNHIPEGMEGCDVDIVDDEDDSDQDDDDDDEEGHGGKDCDGGDVSEGSKTPIRPANSSDHEETGTQPPASDGQPSSMVASSGTAVPASSCSRPLDPEQEAEAELAAECSDTVLLGLRQAAKTLRQVGKHQLARQVENELGLQEKRSIGITDPIRLHLRTVVIERRRAEEAVQERTRIEDAEQQRAKRDLREKKVELEITKTQARIASAQSVATRLEAEETRRRERIAEQEMATARKNLKLYFASQYAGKLLKAAKATSKSKRLQAVIQSLQKNSRAVRKLVPLTWPDMSFMETPQNLEPVHIYKKSKDPQIYASPNFTKVLFNGGRPQEMRPTDAVPHTRLQQLLGQCLPGYKHVVSHYHAADLLRHAQVADTAFLRGVWAYTYVVGKEVFPLGLDSWPPPDVTASSEPSEPPSCSSVPPAKRRVGTEAASSTTHCGAGSKASSSTSRSPALSVGKAMSSAKRARTQAVSEAACSHAQRGAGSKPSISSSCSSAPALPRRVPGSIGTEPGGLLNKWATDAESSGAL